MKLLSKAVETAARNKTLDRAADRLSALFDDAIARAKDRDALEDALHGKWLGHPLHRVLTDVPVGVWTFAGALDTIDAVTGHGRKAASTAIGFGLIAAVPAAITGATDWRRTDGESRRVGVAHALLNGGALSLYTLSLLLRGPSPGLGRLFGFAGLGLVMTSAYFGGHLVTHYRVGIRHQGEAAPVAPLEDAYGAIHDLAEGEPRRAQIDGLAVVLVKHDGRVYALSDVCPHLGCSLSTGTVEGDAIVCPCHGSAFALADGRVVHGPSVFAVETHDLAAAERAREGAVLDAGVE